MPKMKPADAAELEQLVDAHGLGQVLLTLQQICEGKAEHLETNWNDARAARDWSRAARELEKLASRVAIKSGV